MIRTIIYALPRRQHRHALARLGFLPALAFAAFLATTGGSAFGATLVVNAASAPLMDSAATGAQVMGRVPQGTRLTTTGRTSGDWIEVQAPAEVSGWVYGELVRDGVIAASSLKVRSGPGIGYMDIGTLTRGAPVTARGKQGDWLEIAGQPSFLVWIERAVVAERAVADLTASARPATPPAAIPPATTGATAPPDERAAAPARPEIPPAVAPSTSPRPAPPVSAAATTVPAVSRTPDSVPAATAARPATSATAPAPASESPQNAASAKHAQIKEPLRNVGATRPVRSAAPTAASAGHAASPIGRRLISSAPQGAQVAVSGVLRPVGLALFAPSGYRLVSADGNGPARTLCYVTGPWQKLQDRVGQAVAIEGRKYWATGSMAPVVLVYSIR